MSIKHRIGIRLPKENKVYWENQLIMFCKHFDETQISGIDFGKQDIRGAFSITLFDHRSCVPRQLHFVNKDALLGYVQGFNESRSATWNTFKNFMQKVA